MGVHLTFVRSTNLDSWSWDQLRTMKVGGNQAFNDFITKHGRGMVSVTSNAKEKYTSAAAQQYREELKRRAKEDELRYGAGTVTTEGIADAAQVADASKENGKNGAGDDDDFFDSWDKPTNIIAPTPSPKPMAGGPPRIGLSPAGTPQGSRPTTPSLGAVTSPAATVSSSPAALSPAPVVSRAVSSSSVRASSAGSGARTAGAMKLGGGTKSKLGGVKKGGPAINFEEAERKAREEEERIKRLGYDREQEAKQAAEAAVAAAASAKASSAPSSSRGEMVGNKTSGGEVDRLGMGFQRLGFGQVAGLSGEEAAKAASAAKRAAQRANNPAPEESTFARDKFSSSKGISSDMYFGRGLHDESNKGEAQQRLQQFSGASAISSNAYFGREEDEYNQNRAAELEEGLLGVENFSDLERSAKDIARRVMNEAGFDDFSEVQSAVRQGALKLGGYLSDLSRQYG